MLSLMCNQGLGRLGSPQSEASLDRPQAVHMMDSISSSSVGIPAQSTASDEPPRVKLLCSFGGSIIPRPHDGKLRYVGGDTRIMSLPRDISYAELMLRMKEIFEGVTTLKYQQPDEELDALVSVVNDDDVTNMMEEYDKLGADGLNKLRIFLFSGFDNEVTHFDSDERETERRYVDALNSLNDLSMVENNVSMVPEQFMPPAALPPVNLHCLNIPHPSAGSSIHQPGHTPRHNHSDVDSPWSPAYISSGHHTLHDPRSEFPASPSSGRYRMPFGDSHERVLEEIPRQQVNQQYEYQQPNFVDNVVWLPAGVVAGNKAGYPNNLRTSYNNNNIYDGSGSCENCRMAYARQSDLRWRQGQPHMEHSNSISEFVHLPNRCSECFHGKDTYLLAQENEHHPHYNDPHNYERGWAVHHQLNHHVEEPRTYAPGIGRVHEQYTDGNGISYPVDGQLLNSNYVGHDDGRYIRSGFDLANERFHEMTAGNGHDIHIYDQTVGSGSHIQVPGAEDSGLRYGNVPSGYGMDGAYQVSQGSNTANAYGRKVQGPVHGGLSYEASNFIPQTNGQLHPGTIRVPQEGSPRVLRMTLEAQKMFGCDVSPAYASNVGHGAPDPAHIESDNQGFALSSEAFMMKDRNTNSPVLSHHILSTNGSEVTTLMRPVEEKQVLVGNHEPKHVVVANGLDVQDSPSYNKITEKGFESNRETVTNEGASVVKIAGQLDANVPLKDEELSVQNLSFLPELIASVQKAALEGVEDVEEGAQGGETVHSSNAKDLSLHQLKPVNGEVEQAIDLTDDNLNISKIEPTKAEAEALARGLQTIKNDDLEEIRELGSGTYGAVYHGKWKGSDVAIKKIKSSCFSGRPSERERLIADFWKEALMLSSLHHPNVVSFYGIVRDGPDGTLATVTEFMINGSLKQFLQKKDRTIDRRKRLIIAMDAAFGMEYLHGKHIVHFDLKCENLLVNMRDPQRPVCKIGDLGLSKVRQHTLVSGGIRGTLPWMAPELLSGKSNMVTEKIDVYSFGIVMWELLTGEEPYADMHCASIIGGIVNNTLRPQTPTWCDPEWKALMESCWSSDPGERPSFAEISQKLRRMAAAMNVK